MSLQEEAGLIMGSSSLNEVGLCFLGAEELLPYRLAWPGSILLGLAPLQCVSVWVGGYHPSSPFLWGSIGFHR